MDLSNMSKEELELLKTEIDSELRKKVKMINTQIYLVQIELFDQKIVQIQR